MPIRLPLLPALLLLAGSALPASSQNLRVAFLSSRSSNPEFTSSSGHEVSIGFGGRVWRAEVGLSRIAAESEKMGTVCRVYSPRVSCSPALTTTSASIRSVRLGVHRPFPLGRWGEVLAGVGASLGSLDAESRATDGGARADLFFPFTGQPGGWGSLRLALRPLRAVPLYLEAGYRAHGIAFNGCADPEEETIGYAPFCGLTRFDDLDIGISFRIPPQGGNR